jgi:hypothetical protein
MSALNHTHPGTGAATRPIEIPPGKVAELRAFAAELLALSDERDQWHQYAMTLGRWMYGVGYADGQRDQAREDNRAFAAAPVSAAVAEGPTAAELAARRADHGPMCRCPEHRGAVA